MSLRTLDQQRAEVVWALLEKRAPLSADFSRYRNLVKGAPALIMNSGLLATLAFMKGKAKEEEELLHDLLSALVQRKSLVVASASFDGVRRHILGLDGHGYMRLTREALELLKWMRQFVDATDVRGSVA